MLNPSLWPPSNLVRWGEGLVLPALAVAGLVANVVLLRFMMDHFRTSLTGRLDCLSAALRDLATG